MKWDQVLQLSVDEFLDYLVNYEEVAKHQVPDAEECENQAQHDTDRKTCK
ncbi:hypothetical protein Pcac1_g26808 [Phytophthora cactorum]|nr:hypothetical protein Pcac1_g26808 [Phytophthora cactorum]